MFRTFLGKGLVTAFGAFCALASVARADVVVTLDSPVPVTSSPAAGDYRYSYDVAPRAPAPTENLDPATPASSTPAPAASAGNQTFSPMAMAMNAMFNNGMNGGSFGGTSPSPTAGTNSNDTGTTGGGTGGFGPSLAPPLLSSAAASVSGTVPVPTLAAAPPAGGGGGSDPLGAPEPGSLALLAIASPFALVWLRRKRARAAG